MPKKILIIAGEASSDYHAASLVKAMNSITADIKFYGLGGSDMQNAGVDIITNIVNLAVIGPIDVIKNYSKFKNIYDDLCYRIKQDKPDCAILIDYPGFNLKIAKYLKDLNIPVIYYISPQIWAWGKDRIKKIKKLVDKMIVFFEFEEVLYKKENINVSFVGHPLLDTVKQTKDRVDFLYKSGLDPKKITIGILPGSRDNEVSRILPIMIKAAKLIQSNIGADRAQFLLPLAKTVKEEFVRNILKQTQLEITLIKDDTYNAISSCKIAMVASGTATLETALLGIPLAIIYKVSSLLYLIVRPIIKIPHIGLVNVVAGKKIVEEFIQYKARPDLIAAYMIKLLKDEDYYDNIKTQLAALKPALGSPGASLRAAEEVVRFLSY